MSLAPLRLRPVRRLLAAYAVNQLGDWSGEMALAIGVYATTHSAVAVAAVWLAQRVVLAPVLGGLLVAAAGVQAALLLDVVSFLAAAAAVRSVRCPSAGEAEAATALARVRAALAHVRHHPVLVRLIAADSASMLLLAMLTPVEVAFVVGTLGATEADYGSMLAAWGAGMLLGAAVAAAGERLPVPALLGFATLAMASSCLGVGTASAMPAVLAWSLAGGVGNGIYGMACVTAVQERTADAMQTSVAALGETLGSILPGLGFLAGGLLAATASPRAVYLIAGVGTLAVLLWAVIALRSADWSLRGRTADQTDIRSIVLPETAV